MYLNRFIQTIINPFIPINIGLYPRIVHNPAGILKLPNDMYTAEKGLPCFTVDIHILIFGGNVRDDENLSEAGLPIEIAARKKQRIAVQIVQHIAMF